jgi:hypothetical protein
MALPAELIYALTRPGNVIFSENQAVIDRVCKDDLIPSTVEGGTLWHPPESSAGISMLVRPSGHAVLYGEHGRRILYMDAGGTPLHECAWDSRPAKTRLLRARLQLDWGQWIGIKPEGLVNVACVDLSSKPGWQNLTKTDLHRMAGQAMGVSPDEVALFYDDESLSLNAQGQVTIRHRKDALYVLKEADFEHPRFMACMGAMHWGRIDFLPVVELFQSLLAGTGSAVFELIRGLYDDQNSQSSPRVLRYRGIPTYPSPQAFQLFSTYFVPEARQGTDPFSLFMDPRRSAEVAWHPRSDAPLRSMDQERGLSVTVVGGVPHKVIKREDPDALPFTRPKARGTASGSRLVGATKDSIVLQEGDRRETIPLKQEWGVTKESPLPEGPAAQLTWRSLFPEGPPHVAPILVYFAVPMYPDDDTVIEELATQSLAIEQILDYLEPLRLARPSSRHMAPILIDQWDALIGECIDAAQVAAAIVLYDRPEFAQRHAQRLWDVISGSSDLAAPAIRFLPIARRPQAYATTYDFILRWIPFAQYEQMAAIEQALEEIAKALSIGGFAIIAGPPDVERLAPAAGLLPEAVNALSETPGVGMLRTILPKARIRPEVILYLLRKVRWP